MCYSREKGELCHLCYIIISESTQHDTVAVHMFQKKLITLLTKRRQGRRPQKILYISDGCAAQYKNCKNFLNLCSHEADFGVPAEWHFFATSHGKSAGDGAGRTLKRLATKTSLQHAYKGPHSVSSRSIPICSEQHQRYWTCSFWKAKNMTLKPKN